MTPSTLKRGCSGTDVRHEATAFDHRAILANRELNFDQELVSTVRFFFAHFSWSDWMPTAVYETGRSLVLFWKCDSATRTTNSFWGSAFELCDWIALNFRAFTANKLLKFSRVNSSCIGWIRKTFCTAMWQFLSNWTYPGSNFPKQQTIWELKWNPV